MADQAGEDRELTRSAIEQREIEQAEIEGLAASIFVRLYTRWQMAEPARRVRIAESMAATGDDVTLAEQAFDAAEQFMAEALRRREWP